MQKNEQQHRQKLKRTGWIKNQKEKKAKRMTKKAMQVSIKRSARMMEVKMIVEGWVR